MAQATREESVLQQFYTKEIMPSRPLDIISALASVIQYMKAEGVGVLMGLHLLNSLNRRLNGAVIMGSDSQALTRPPKIRVHTQVTTSLIKYIMQQKNCKQNRMGYSIEKSGHK